MRGFDKHRVAVLQQVGQLLLERFDALEPHAVRTLGKLRGKRSDRENKVHALILCVASRVEMERQLVFSQLLHVAENRDGAASEIL